jgi:hypothetical protein
MRTILIEDSIYKISQREFNIIKKMEQDINDSAALHHTIGFEAEHKLYQHLEAAKLHYRFIGTVDFQYRS